MSSTSSILISGTMEQVILVCDGVNSQARSLLTGRPKPQTPSDYSIHRAAMKADTIRADKKCAREAFFFGNVMAVCIPDVYSKRSPGRKYQNLGGG